MTQPTQQLIADGKLNELSPFREDDSRPTYRSCDYCYETAVDDIYKGILDQDKWRKFYETVDEYPLTVCEHCVAEHFNEPQEAAEIPF